MEIGAETIPISASFENDEWRVLLDFAEYATDLNKLDLVRLGGPAELQITYRSGEPMLFRTTLPPDDQLFALMHRLRPLILEKEATYFNRIANTLARRIDNDQFREQMQRLRSTFSLTKHQSMFQIIVNGDFVINSEKALQTWLNGFEFHRFRDKRDTMEEVFVMFPENASKTMFVMLLIDKLRAIQALAGYVMVITNQRERFSITM